MKTEWQISFPSSLSPLNTFIGSLATVLRTETFPTVCSVRSRINLSNELCQKKERCPATGRGGPRGSVSVKAPDFLTFGTTRMVGRQLYASAAFTPGEIPGTHFQGLSRPQGTWFCRREPRKKSPVTPPGIDPETVRLVAQCINHYATPGPELCQSSDEY